MIAIYASFTILLAALALMPWWKAKAILFLGLVIAAPFVYFDTLSRPKLLNDEFRNDEMVAIIGYSWKEGVAVYYWLDLPGIEEPRYYWEPWTDESRERLEKMREGMEEGMGMMFINPFERSWETEKSKTIHPIPPPVLPIKPKPDKPIQEFRA